MKKCHYNYLIKEEGMKVLDVKSGMPVPYFEVNQQLDILSHSEHASSLFASVLNFLSLVDTGSKKKVMNQLLSKTDMQSFECNLRTFHNPLTLFQIYAQWDDGIGKIVCIEKETEYRQATHILHKLREQLHSADFHDYENQMRKDLLPLLNVNVSDLNRLSLSEYSGSLADIPTKIETVLDLLSVLRPELIEIGKSDYLDLITNELTNIRAIIHYLLAVVPEET